MTDERHHADLAALLGWYRDMGADEALGEAPIDWLERGDAAPGRQVRFSPASPVTARPPARPPPGRPPAPCSGPLPPCCRTLPSWGHEALPAPLSRCKTSKAPWRT